MLDNINFFLTFDISSFEFNNFMICVTFNTQNNYIYLTKGEVIRVSLVNRALRKKIQTKIVQDKTLIGDLEKDPKKVLAEFGLNLTERQLATIKGRIDQFKKEGKFNEKDIVSLATAAAACSLSI